MHSDLLPANHVLGQVPVLRRLELLIEASEETWRTFSWSEHLMRELLPQKVLYLSGGTLLLPRCEVAGRGRSLVVQSIPRTCMGFLEF